MRAMLCEAYGPPETLVMRDIPEPTPGPGQVAITVRSCGINFPDGLRMADKYQERAVLPFSPGGEVAGLVRAVGEGVTGFAPGDRVFARVGSGGAREVAIAQAERCTLMPDNIDFPAAAGLTLNYGTALHALEDRAQLKPGEQVLVLGAAGGVGLAAIEVAKIMGGRVIAAASSQEKLDLALARGADGGFVYPSGPLDRDQQKAFSDAIKEATGGGADVIVDPVGGDYAEPALRAMAWEGRYLVIGFAAGGIPRIPLNLTLLKGCDVRGVYYGDLVVRDPARNQAILATLAGWIADGRLSPLVTQIFPLERSGEAIRTLMDRRALGKVIIQVSE